MTDFFLQWVAPPVVGAIIGYVTNAIAIKMLFRPLTEKRVFGLRVPLTPGILPKQRHRLAVNIGKMVSRELLTEAIVRERLRTPEFRFLIEKSVSGYTERLLSSSISDAAAVASTLPVAVTEGADGSDLGRAVGSLVDRFVVSDSFATLVRSVVRHAVEKLGTRTPSELFGNAGSALPGLPSLLERLLSSLSTPEIEKRLSDALEGFLRKAADEGKPFGSYLPESIAESAARLADLLYPVAAEAILRFLDDPAIRAEMEAKGKVLLRDAILELNAFQRFFVSAAQYEKTLNDRMPAIVDNMIERVGETVQEEGTRKRFTDAVRKSVEDVLSKPADKALSSLKTDPSAASRLLAGRIASAFGSSSGRERLGGLLKEFLAKMEKEPIDRIIRDRLGLDLLALADMASFSLIAYIREESPSAVPRMVDGFLREHGADSLSFFFGIDAGEKAKWDAAISHKVVELFDERVSAVIETLDVQTMVSDRIDSLDMEDVERIVLDVLSDQLKWIDIFGAILGGAMGLFQSLLALALNR